MSQNPISDSFQQILAKYENTIRTESNSKLSSVYSHFNVLAKALQASPHISKDHELLVDWSCGKGGWAFVPWVAIFHNQETHSTQKGVYCIYLFRQDMQGFYLTLNQGVTSGMDYRVTGEKRFHKLIQTAEKFRQNSIALSASGFKLDNSIDLKATSTLGQNYVKSTIAYKYYPVNIIPSDKELLKDLEILLTEYLSYVHSK